MRRTVLYLVFVLVSALANVASADDRPHYGADFKTGDDLIMFSKKNGCGTEKASRMECSMFPYATSTMERYWSDAGCFSHPDPSVGSGCCGISRPDWFDTNRNIYSICCYVNTTNGIRCDVAVIGQD